MLAVIFGTPLNSAIKWSGRAWVKLNLDAFDSRSAVDSAHRELCRRHLVVVVVRSQTLAAGRPRCGVPWGTT